MPAEPYFTQELFKFLTDLRTNNNRQWFLAHKERYERHVHEPMLRFVLNFGAHLARISPYFLADVRPVRGSIFRIQRDTRFSKDKRPYKTYLGARFPHRQVVGEGRAPSFYLHLDPRGCFAGAGLWHPDSRALNKVRVAIVEHPQAWAAVHRNKLKLEGDALVRPPRGCNLAHPFIEDLKRKDFITSIALSEKEVCSASFLSTFAAACRKMSPLVKFVTKAMDLRW